MSIFDIKTCLTDNFSLNTNIYKQKIIHNTEDVLISFFNL